MEDYKAPLADAEIAAGDELTLEDIARMHESVDVPSNAPLFSGSFEEEHVSTLELSTDLQDDSPDDLALAIEHQRIQIPQTPVQSPPPTSPPPPEPSPAPSESPASESPAQSSTANNTASSAEGQSQLLLKMGNETYDLSKKDDIAWLEQQFQDLFSQCLYPYLQRMSRIWNSEEEVGAMYQKLESLSRERGPVEEIMAVAQQVNVYRDMTEKEKLNSDEILSVLTRLETLQNVLKRYQNLFEGLI